MQQPPLRAVIFDMDGVLIDSEPMWQQAEFNILGALGLPVTPEAIAQTTGLRIDEVAQYWQQRCPAQHLQSRDIEDDIIAEVIQSIRRDGQAMSGVSHALQACRLQGLKVGLATSSSSDIIEAVLEKLHIRDAFDAIQSAESLPLGKPHPEVYLRCAQRLQVNPDACLAVEDSFNGMIAARAAKMQTLVIPAEVQWNAAHWSAAQHKLPSLQALPALLAQLAGTRAP
ncbi:hexitol phosphatase HxpB [Shewanella sp. YIC-542]|uniref:hexitol phosphatase HxpB n=1 Tax=Shewanella mytili TaxID=3377111 RepID=UPI00398E5C0A